MRLLGRGMEKWGGLRKNVGEEGEEGGVNEERKDCRWKNEGEEDGREGEARNEKAFTQCKKGCAGKIKGEISRRIARSRTQNEARREKSELRRVKNESDSSKKCRKLSLKRGKAGKTEIWERKRWGGEAAKKWALLPILQCYEVAKWAQMKFSRIFFRRSLAGNAEMPYLCTRNREATLLQERVTL